jgi:hypothetical protein
MGIKLKIIYLKWCKNDVFLKIARYTSMYVAKRLYIIEEEFI